MATEDAEPENSKADAGVPRHIAIIMDGNNRWARRNNQSGSAGHRAGALAARKIVNLCADRGIEFLTLFVFSSENWARPPREVNGLMALFLDVLQRKEVNKLHDRNIKVRFIGNRERFPEKLRQLMQAAEEMTAGNTAMTVAVAADYGGRWDIAEAARAIAREVQAGRLIPDDVDEALMQRYISLGDAPMPDLCIRTGGEQRISNFLLWQFAYTEFYFTSTLWPDFDEADLDHALRDYAGRQRRFGRVSGHREGA